MARNWLKRLLLFIIRLVGRVYALLPRSGKWLLARLLGLIVFGVLRFRYLTLLRNIRVVFPQKTKAEIRTFLKRIGSWMAYYVLQYLEVSQLNHRDRSRFEFFGWENLEQAKRLGRGYFMLASHLGNPDMALKGLSMTGEKVALITKEFSVGLANDVWFALRSAPNIGYIPAHGKKTAFEIFRYLGAGQGVIFVLDQFMASPYGIKSTFFGRPTGTAYGLARFFVKSKAPIVPCYGIEGTEKFEIHFLPPIFFEEERVQRILEEPDVSAQDRQLVELFNREIEQMILRAPEHWMWIHRRWKRWR